MFHPSTYDWKWDPDDDYALIKLESEFYHDPGDMDLSNHSDATLNGVGANFHLLGYPIPYPASCSSSNELLVHTSNNDVTATTAEVIRWKGDAAVGDSGGALYFCPDDADDACDSDDTGHVVAVVAAFSDYFDRVVGARASSFRSAAIDIMDTQ